MLLEYLSVMSTVNFIIVIKISFMQFWFHQPGAVCGSSYTMTTFKIPLLLHSLLFLFKLKFNHRITIKKNKQQQVFLGLEKNISDAKRSVCVVLGFLGVNLMWNTNNIMSLNTLRTDGWRREEITIINKIFHETNHHNDDDMKMKKKFDVLNFDGVVDS